MKENRISNQVYTIKCAMAVVIAILAAKAIVPEDTLSAAFVSVLCVKPTFYTGLVEGLEQFVASIWGGLITSILIIIFGKGVMVAGVALMVVIYTCRQLKWENYFVVSSFTVLYMVLLPYANTVDGMTIRIVSVLLGVASAAAVNFFLSFFRYKKYFDYKIRLYSVLMFEKLKQTEAANRQADIIQLGRLYREYEEIYGSLGSLTGELNNIEKELRFRTSAGGLDYDRVWDMYRIAENLKMAVRYLQDISFVSKALAPVHSQIPAEWKKKLDEFWEMEDRRYQQILRVLSGADTGYIIENRFDAELPGKISEAMKSCDVHLKNIYAQVLTIVSDFQQLDLVLNNLGYAIAKYREE